MNCLVCHKPALMNRGLCKSCYNRARYKVQQGKATWKELEDKGEVLPVVPKCKKLYGWIRGKYR
jgi:hypothetical protein